MKLFEQCDPSGVYKEVGDTIRCGIVQARPYTSWTRIAPLFSPYVMSLTFQPETVYEIRTGIAMSRSGLSGMSLSARATQEAFRAHGLVVHRAEISSSNEIILYVEVKSSLVMVVGVICFEICLIANVAGPVIMRPRIEKPKAESLAPVSAAKPAAKERKLTTAEEDALVDAALNRADDGESTSQVITEDSGLAVTTDTRVAE